MTKKFEEKISTRPVFRVPMKGAPPPKGFAVRYQSGMEGTTDLEPGYWLSDFYVDRDGHINFNFDRDLHFGFDDESDAKKASEALKQGADVMTTVVKVGF
jgi:hypothetical protein